MNPLRVLAVASNEAIRDRLLTQLAQHAFLRIEGVVLTLADAQKLFTQQKPDLLIMDLTGREVDACLFLEVINYNVDPDGRVLAFGLHEALDPNIIVKAVSSGVKEFIHYPQDVASLDSALQKHWNFLQKLAASQTPAARESTGKLVSVFGSKGGAGTSTIAVNMAHQLHRLTRKPVALLDMDQVFGNTAVMLNFRASYGVSDLFAENPNDLDDTLLDKIVVHHETGIDLVVACKNVLDENPMIPAALLERVVAYLRSHYAYVIVDLPTHTIDAYHQYFVENSEEVLLVSCLDIPGLYRTRQYLELVKRHLDMNRVKLVLNRCDLKAAVGMSNETIEAEFKYPAYVRLPNNWQLNVEAMSLGQVLGNVAPTDPLVKGLEELAGKVAGMETAKADRKSSENKMGLLERLTRRSTPHVAG